MRRTALTILLLASACADKESVTDDSAPDPGEVALSGACPLASDFGGFVVSVSADSSDVDGRVADGVVPINVLEEVLVEGDCALMRRNNPYCDPDCDPGYTCDFDGQCLPYPQNQDLGVVSLSGLAEPIAMEPVFPGNTYFSTALAHPVFAGGELITLDMPGGLYGPLTLHGVGAEPLEPLDAEWVVVAGQDLTVRWTPPTDPAARTELQVRVNIDQHGASPGTLWCTFEDDGEGTVPSAAIDALVSAGVTGFPSGSITRRTADHAAAGEGCLDFQVTAPRQVAVDVDGFTPCVGDEDCPDELDCNEEFQICE